MYNTRKVVSESELEGLRKKKKKLRVKFSHLPPLPCESEITEVVIKNVLEAVGAGRVPMRTP